MGSGLSERSIVKLNTQEQKWGIPFIKHCDPRGNVLNLQQIDQNDNDMGDFGHLKLWEIGLSLLHRSIGVENWLIDVGA